MRKYKNYKAISFSPDTGNITRDVKDLFDIERHILCVYDDNHFQSDKIEMGDIYLRFTSTNGGTLLLDLMDEKCEGEPIHGYKIQASNMSEITPSCVLDKIFTEGYIKNNYPGDIWIEIDESENILTQHGYVSRYIYKNPEIPEILGEDPEEMNEIDYTNFLIEKVGITDLREQEIFKLGFMTGCNHKKNMDGIRRLLEKYKLK